jgi:hypothetical protein
MPEESLRSPVFDSPSEDEGEGEGEAGETDDKVRWPSSLLMAPAVLLGLSSAISLFSPFTSFRALLPNRTATSTRVRPHHRFTSGHNLITVLQFLAQISRLVRGRT